MSLADLRKTRLAELKEAKSGDKAIKEAAAKTPIQEMAAFFEEKGDKAEKGAT